MPFPVVPVSRHEKLPGSSGARDEEEEHYSIISMLDVLLATEYEHAKTTSPRIPCAPGAASPTTPSPRLPRATPSPRFPCETGSASLRPQALQTAWATPGDAGPSSLRGPQGPTSRVSPTSSPLPPMHLPRLNGEPSPDPQWDGLDEHIKEVYGSGNLQSLLVQIDQAMRDDSDGEALVQVLQTCESVLSRRAEPKGRMLDRAVAATQSVLQHLLSAQMGAAFAHGVQDVGAVGHGTLRSKGRGPVLQALYASVQGCALQDLFPFAYFLASCACDLAKKAQAAQAELEVMSAHWGVLQKKLQSTCGILDSLASSSPTCEDTFDLRSWMKGLACEVGHRGTTLSKLSDGIAANAEGAHGKLPAAKQFYRPDYRPPPFLEALKGLALEDADQYSGCCKCDVIIKDFEKHCKLTHGPCVRWQPTVGDIVRKAVEFAAQCRDDPTKQQACEGLEDDDIYALYVYTMETEISSKVHAAMSRDAPAADEQKWRPIICHIQRALSRLPPHSLTPLYRSIDCKVTGYEEGRFVVWHPFSAATANPNVIKEVVQGGSLFILRPSEESQGHLIDFLSEFEMEKEVLFSHNTWLRVQQKLTDRTKRFLAEHMGMDWDTMKELDVYELHEVTEDSARQEHALQQQKAARLLAERASSSLVEHLLDGNHAACMQDIRDGAEVQQEHEGTSLLALAAMRDMGGVCAAMAPRLQSITIARKSPAAGAISEVFPHLPEGLASLAIGAGHRVGEAGALAIVSQGQSLRSLRIGLDNGLGLEGIKQVLRGCRLLEDISIGGWQAACSAGLTTECGTVEAVDASGTHIDEDGQFLIATLYPKLSSVALDSCTTAGAEVMAKQCPLLTAVRVDRVSCDGAAALAKHCASLRSFSIGDSNKIGDSGARIIATHRTSLTSLGIGHNNKIGEGGTRAIAEQCASLTSLALGHNNNISDRGARAIADYCTSLVSLSIGDNNALGDRGARAIGDHCTSLTSLHLGCNNRIGGCGARAIAEQCGSLTSFSIGGSNQIGQDAARAIAGCCTSLTSLAIGGNNGIGAGGARAIAERCTSLTSLTIGGNNGIGEGGARAIAEHCTILTSLAIGDDNDIYEGGAVSIAEHCTSLTSLRMGNANGVGEGGAVAIAARCASLTSLHIGDDNYIGEGGARAIAESCLSLASLSIGCSNEIGQGGARAIAERLVCLTSLHIGGSNEIGEGGARTIADHCSSLTSLGIGYNDIGEGGARAIAGLCASLTSLSIGESNDIGGAGARAIAERCTSLRSLSIGGGNDIGEGGAQAIAGRCTSLTSLSIGDNNYIGELGARAIASQCISLTALSVGDVNDIGEGGVRAIAEHCTALTSLSIGYNEIGEGGAATIAEHCTSLTFLSLGDVNEIGEGGAGVIAEKCASLTSLIIGGSNEIGEGGAKAIAAHCSLLTLLCIGDNNHIGEGGARAIAQCCTSLTSLSIGDDNGIGEGGAAAIAEHCTSLTSLSISDNNKIGEGGARAIAEHGPVLTSLTIHDHSIGEEGRRLLARQRPAAS